MKGLRPIPGRTFHFAGRDGHIYTTRFRGRAAFRQLSEHDSLLGYRRVSIGDKKFEVHRLVALAFRGPRPPQYQVRHLDGVKTNNVPSNLKWGTAQENADDRERHGRTARGERGKSKVTERDVREIRRRVSRGEEQKKIMSEYGLSRSGINHIITGKNWSWLT